MSDNEETANSLPARLEAAAKEIENLQNELTETNKGIIALYNDLDSTNQEIKKKNEELNQALKKLREAQDKLIHSEKMAAIGAMVVTLNHEINNPLMIIQGNAQLLRIDPMKLDTQVINRLRQIEIECKRIKGVVQKIRNYEDLIPIEYLNSAMYNLHNKESNSQQNE